MRMFYIDTCFHFVADEATAERLLIACGKSERKAKRILFREKRKTMRDRLRNALWPA